MSDTGQDPAGPDDKRPRGLPVRVFHGLVSWLAGYVAASVVAAATLIAIMVVSDWAATRGPLNLPSFTEVLRGLAFLAGLVGVYALPGFLILRLILFMIRISTWKAFGGAGAINGFLLVLLLFTPLSDPMYVNYHSDPSEIVRYLFQALSFVFAGSIAGIAYGAVEKITMSRLAGPST